jgi:hypothetical protein
MQLFRTREIGDSEEIKVKLNHLFIISMLTDIMFFKWVKSCDA